MGSSAHIDIIATLGLTLGQLCSLGCGLSLLFLLNALAFSLLRFLLAPFHFFKLKLHEKILRLEY